MKNLTLLLLLLLGAFCTLAQTSFENKKLALINDIVHKTTRKNVTSFMEDKGFEKGDIEEGSDEVHEVLTFTSEFDVLHIAYTKESKISSIFCMFSGAINVAFIDMELKDKGYSVKIEKGYISGPDEPLISKSIWSKSGVKFNFITYANDEEKIGYLAYGVYEN